MIHMIKLLLDEDSKSIVKILIAHQVVKDRRSLTEYPECGMD